jgi:magnesium transporter
VTRDLLSFRKIMMAAREVLHELASRRSPYVSEATQPFLEKMVDTLERLGADLTVERDILSETLNLYMSITSHRTNKIVSRLTVISVVFLPLTFLCGVYGMNFEVLPELGWRYSYLGFWLVVIAIAAGLLTYMKRRKWW